MEKSAKEMTDLIDSFLQPVKAQAEKEAADQGTSFKDTAAATPANQSKSETLSTSQNNLGVEQQAEANNGDVNITDDSLTNKDSDGVSPVDNQGPKTLDTDQPVQSEGNLGSVRKQEITQEQKQANETVRLGNTVLNFFLKQAMEEGEDCDGCGKATCECSDKEASESNGVALFDKLAHEAALAGANDYYHSFIAGMEKRARDEYELASLSADDWANMGISEEMLKQAGGIAGLLDKLAMEDPVGVLPEEAMPEEALPEAGLEGAGEEIPGGGEADMLPDELAAAGVEPGDLDEAAAEIAQLQEAGLSDEEILQAIDELAAEEADVPVEEKIASQFNRERIEIAKAHFRGE
jgi:hypothetical protein